MSVQESTASREAALEAEDEIDVNDYCAWWVIVGGYATSKSKHVHLPAAIRTGEANDPDTEPPAETLCHIDGRKGSSWRSKSHTMMPVDYRPVCGHCMNALERLADAE